MSMAQVAVTVGGPHPPSWSAVTATDQIIQVSPVAVGRAALDASRIRGMLIPILMDYFNNVRAAERSVSDLSAPLTLDMAAVNKVADQIVKASVGSVHETFFTTPEVVDSVKMIIGHRTMTAMDIERKWRIDAATGA